MVVVHIVSEILPVLASSRAHMLVAGLSRFAAIAAWFSGAGAISSGSPVPAARHINP
ncbi:hypothetical protein [Methanoregula sp.]|uniref:hypothetical protein n=1 Tax=Methanoregula sp. TaxID=2052170 RepID=UPI002369B3F0|nr:hypothetical protein [Methanoregula sp.]MDD1685607.1 hypothetical protein [Methanoregula sp.]